MSDIPAQMLLNDCRWQGGWRWHNNEHTEGDHSARVRAAPPAAQVARNYPLGAGDFPWLWCPASRPVLFMGSSEIKPCLAGYTPFVNFGFNMHAQPGLSTQVVLDDGHIGGPYYSSIYEAAHCYFISIPWSDNSLDEWDNGVALYYVRTPQIQCERLAFIANVDRSAECLDQVAGWYGPHTKTPPIPQNETIWRRAAGSNLCMSLIKRRSGDCYTAADQDLPYSVKNWNGAFGFKISSNLAGPGFANPVGGAEQWAGWNPAKAPRPEDVVPYAPGAIVTLSDVNYYFEWVCSPNGRWYQNYIGSEVMATHVLSGYDWRFLYTFMTRDKWVRTAPRFTTLEFRYHGPLYWSISTICDPPTGCNVGNGMWHLVAAVIERAYTGIVVGGTTYKVSRGTTFDVKIQAMVYAMRCSPAMVSYLENGGRNVIVLNSRNAWSVRVWSHTNFRVEIRQAMPVPNTKAEYEPP